MNKPSLAKRNRRFVEGNAIAIWKRITEDRKIEGFEMVEMDDALMGVATFAVALDSEHVVTQAMPRATDPEYVGELVAFHQMAMSRLPDAA